MSAGIGQHSINIAQRPHIEFTFELLGDDAKHQRIVMVALQPRIDDLVGDAVKEKGSGLAGMAQPGRRDGPADAARNLSKSHTRDSGAARLTVALMQRQRLVTEK